MTLHPAIQRRICLTACTILQAVCDDMTPATEDKVLQKRLASVSRWQHECMETLKGQALSQGAKRDLDALFSRFSDLVHMDEMLEGKTEFINWSASVYAGHCFMIDAKATCPAYFKGSAWKWLYYHVDALAVHLETTYPPTSERGIAVYMEVA